MDNSQCPHGKCLEHKMEVERETGEKRFVLAPELFGLKKTYWFERHCGKPMTICKQVEQNRCRKCGRTEDREVDWHLAVCSCCGYFYKNSVMGAGI